MKIENVKLPSVHTAQVEVRLGNGTVVTIRELSWPDAMSLYTKLLGQWREVVDPAGNLVVSAEKLVEILAVNAELASWLAIKGSGRDDTWLQERSLGDVLDVAVETAVLNVGIIVNRIKNVSGRLKGLFAPAGEAQPPTPTGTSNAS